MLVINLRKLCYVFVSLFSLSACVLANPISWQGPYAGLSLGGGFGNSHIISNAGSVTNTSYFTTAAAVNAVNNAGTWRKKPAAIIVDFQGGHDWVWKQIIYGVVLDFGSLSLSSSQNVSVVYPNSSDQYSLNSSMSTNWLLTLRGKFGLQKMLSYPTLFYVTAGMAMTQLKVSNNFSDNSFLVGMGSSQSRQNQIGWTTGVGIDVVAFKRGSVNFEYLYINIPSVSILGDISNTQGGFGIPELSLKSPFSSNASFHANLFKIGLNYRFDE